jgi:hypothetical protein
MGSQEMRTALSLIALGTLAACGQSGSSNETTAGSASVASSSVTLQPGQWESQVQLANASQPSPGQRAATVRFCITPEQAANPTAAAMAGDTGRSHCTMKDYSVAGGRIHGTTVCDMGTGGSMRMTTDGTYTATTYAMTVKSQIDIRGRSINSETHVNAKRVGDCPASAADGKGGG